MSLLATLNFLIQKKIDNEIPDDEFETCITDICSLIEDYKNDAISNDELEEKYNEIVKQHQQDSENYVSKYVRTHTCNCKVCRKVITVSDIENKLIKLRQLDCASTDWQIGCCCCGNGDEYHKPECIMFLCKDQCHQKWRDEYSKLIDEYGKYESMSYNVGLKKSLNKEYVSTAEDDEIIRKYSEISRKLNRHNSNLYV